MNKPNYVIITDSNTDLPALYNEKHDIRVVSMDYILDGAEHTGYPGDLTPEEFFGKLRSGSTSKTTQANPAALEAAMNKACAEGYDILHLAFSSGLSGTYSNAVLAADLVKANYPERKIYVVDTLAASLGQGLIVHKAVEKRDAGASLEENRDYIESIKLNVCHYFTVDDLNHLYRGGRVSKTSATIGSMLHIKPVLQVDNEGHLIPLQKVRGRKQSLVALVDALESLVTDTDTAFISHGDCEEDATFVKELIEERFKTKNFIINQLGASIGSHSGPGTLALFFMGKHR